MCLGGTCGKRKEPAEQQPKKAEQTTDGRSAAFAVIKQLPHILAAGNNKEL